MRAPLKLARRLATKQNKPETSSKIATKVYYVSKTSLEASSIPNTFLKKILKYMYSCSFGYDRVYIQ